MTLRNLDLNLLAIFVAAAETRSMSGAAEHLKVTQSSVSQGVRQLEDYLGVLLFDRSRRPMVLTVAGLTLLNRARVLLAESAVVCSVVQDANRGIAPEVTIGLVDSFAATCAAAFTSYVAQKTTRLAVRTGLTPFHGEKLYARELDIAVTTDTFEDLDGLVTRRLYSERFVVLMPGRGAPLRLDRGQLQELARASPMIRFNSKSHLGMQVATLVRRAGIRASSRLEVDTADMLVAMVAAGQGWALTTPTCIAQGAHQIGSVRIGLLEGINDERSLYLVGRQGEHEKLFDACYEGAMQAVDSALRPLLTKVSPELPPMIKLAG